MSNYYLPVIINDRRNFVCNLSDDESATIIGFVVDITQGCTLLSIDKKSNFISKLAFKDNKCVEKLEVSITKEGEEYILDFIDREKEDDKLKKNLKDKYGADGATIPDEFKGQDGKFDPSKVDSLKSKDLKKKAEEACIDAKKCDGLFIDKKPSTVLLRLNVCEFDREKKEFRLIIRYGNFKYAMKFYTYCQNDNIRTLSAALDFGSEASQVRISGNDVNTYLIDSFTEMSRMDNYAEYYQGKRGDDLFKSILFINTRPQDANFAESPMKYGKDTFVQTLMSTGATNDELKNLNILPNLKLVELAAPGAGIFNDVGQQIDFENERSEVRAGNPPSLASMEQRENILRLIMGNFIHAIMNSIKDEQCLLRLILMVPNVYYQSKVHKIMEDAYRDFDIMHSQDLYGNVKGLEVEVLSESDASFLGIKSSRPGYLKDQKDAYSLIIDAGKGTTDFSILKQGSNFSEYESVYRYGIPASGHVITYSFYEAAYNFFENYGILLDNDDFIGNATQVQKKEFMDCLDELKSQFGRFEEGMPEVLPNKDQLRNLDNIIRYVKDNFIDKRLQLPKIKEFINADNQQTNIYKLKTLLEQALKKYTDFNKIKFLNVILTGRGFLFSPFREAVENMLTKNKLCDKDNIKFIGDGGNNILAKTICMEGALSFGRVGDISKNSGLVGSPMFYENDSDIFASLRNVIINFNRKQEDCERYIYTKGLKIKKVQNPKLFISGRVYDIPLNKKQDVLLYYIGNGFLCQTNEKVQEIEERNFETVYDGIDINELIYESLFPYYNHAVRPNIELNLVYDDTLKNNKESINDDTVNGNEVNLEEAIGSKEIVVDINR